MIDKIQKAFEESVSVKTKFFNEKNAHKILETAKIIAQAFNDGKRLFLLNRFKIERPGLPAIALNTDMAVITSIANDYDFSEVFARQLKSLAEEGDIVIAISTSGNSKNILKAMDVAKKRKLTKKILGLECIK